VVCASLVTIYQPFAEGFLSLPLGGPTIVPAGPTHRRQIGPEIVAAVSTGTIGNSELVGTQGSMFGIASVGATLKIISFGCP